MARLRRLKPIYAYFLIFLVVVPIRLFDVQGPSQADLVLAAHWDRFRIRYDVTHFGEDGQFVRAARNGHNVFYNTYVHAWRFTRRGEKDKINSCNGCHSINRIAYAFVNSDRFNPTLGRRVSFEESVARCYVKHLDGFVPTVYDPAIRDIRILARVVAHHLGLTEGKLDSGKVRL